MIESCPDAAAMAGRSGCSSPGPARARHRRGQPGSAARTASINPTTADRATESDGPVAAAGRMTTKAPTRTTSREGVIVHKLSRSSPLTSVLHHLPPFSSSRSGARSLASAIIASSSSSFFHARLSATWRARATYSPIAPSNT